jgi:diguanylate cyclase (GGDEF)-like protein
VIEAANGEQALTALRANPNARLLITDYNMPGMDGFQLTTNIRKEFDKSSIAIIGLSGQGSPTLSAKFIKNGANDFLTKPFSHEELYCRVMQNMEALEHIEEIRDAANRDYLTHLYNRRYFFEQGEAVFDRASASQLPVTIAVMDIDLFKKINDGYGHDVGDIVLKSIAELLNEHFGNEIVARFGGEEFCVLFDGMDIEDAENRLEYFRSAIEKSSVETEAGIIEYTISIGATDTKGKTLDEMIKRADEYLYLAKERGRNQVVSG